jgi:hypothetical protein
MLHPNYVDEGTKPRSSTTKGGVTMFTVWKYPLTIVTELQVPKPAILLTIQAQMESPVAWFVVDPSAETEKVVIHAIGTGHSTDAAIGGPNFPYLGLVQLHQGSLVVHFFREITS